MGASEVILRQSFASTVFDSIALPAMFSIVWLKQYSSNSISRRCCKRQAMSRYPEYRTLNSTIRSHRGHIGSSPWADITQKQTDCEMLNFWRLCNSIYILKCFRQIQNCNNCFFFCIQCISCGEPVHCLVQRETLFEIAWILHIPSVIRRSESCNRLPLTLEIASRASTVIPIGRKSVRNGQFLKRSWSGRWLWIAWEWLWNCLGVV